MKDYGGQEKQEAGLTLCMGKNHVPKTMYVQYIVPILFIYAGNGGENLSLVYIIITSKFSKILYWGKLDCNKGEFSYLT